MLLKFLVLLLSGPVGFASYEANFPSLAIGLYGTPPSKIQAALSAIDSPGKLVLIVDSVSRQNTMNYIAQLPAADRDRILVMDSPQSYRWIRDSNSIWEQSSQGKWQLVISNHGPGRFETAQMSTLLSLCSKGKVVLPQGFFQSNQYGDSMTFGEGGNILTDGDGHCIVGESSDWEVGTEEAFVKRFHCKSLVKIPKAAWPEHHPNKHSDLLVSFLGKGIALVPKVPEHCTKGESPTYKKLLQSTADLVKSGGSEVYRIDLDTCPNGALSSPTNMTETSKAFIVPNVNESETEPNQFEQTKKLMQQLMAQGKIPQKEIIGMPISREEIVLGGAARCMTLPIPDVLASCTQTTLDDAIEKLITKSNHTCLTSNSDLAACRAAKDFSVLLSFVIQAETAKLTSSKEEIGISQKQSNQLNEKAKSLDESIYEHCPR